MIDLKQLQREVYQNKVEKGFNITDICREFCYLQGELAEAFEAYDRREPGLGEELADVAIYLLGLAEILHVDLESEIVRKIEINRKRKYVTENGVLKRRRVDREHSSRGFPGKCLGSDGRFKNRERSHLIRNGPIFVKESYAGKKG